MQALPHVEETGAHATHVMRGDGGIPGGQPEFLHMRHADVGLPKIPEALPFGDDCCNVILRP